MSDDYPSISELERIATADRGVDYARERREDADAMRLCDELEQDAYERAADEFELIAHMDWRGVPIEGHESPRYFDSRLRDYRAWLLSREGARTRKNMHPRLDAKMRDAFARRDAEAGRLEAR